MKFVLPPKQLKKLKIKIFKKILYLPQSNHTIFLSTVTLFHFFETDLSLLSLSLGIPTHLSLSLKILSTYRRNNDASRRGVQDDEGSEERTRHADVRQRRPSRDPFQVSLWGKNGGRGCCG